MSARATLVGVAVMGVVMTAGVVSAGAVDFADPVNVSAIAGEEFNGPVATFDDLSADSSDFTATIDWGDGASGAGTIVSLGTCPDLPDRIC